MTCAGVLLTGGASRRMGTDKATLLVGAETFAGRVARLLETVCDPAIEVGPGVTSLRAVQEDPPGAGPLGAVLAGADALGAVGSVGALLAVGCDLPLVDVAALEMLATHRGDGSVVPEVRGRLQYACARWSPSAIAYGRDAYARGDRALRALAAAGDTIVVDADRYAAALSDADTPNDLRRLGLTYDRSS